MLNTRDGHDRSNQAAKSTNYIFITSYLIYSCNALHFKSIYYTDSPSVCLPHLHPSLGSPGEASLVGQHRCRHRGTVVAPPAHQHHTQPGHVSLRGKGHLGGVRGHLFTTEEGKLGGDTLQRTHTQKCQNKGPRTVTLFPSLWTDVVW